MNSKDLLSINEAFAKATSKVTTDQPAKMDEVVTEGSKEDPLGVGKTSELSGATRDVKTDKEKRKEKKKEDKQDKKKEKKKAKKEKSATEGVVDEFAQGAEFTPRQPVRIVDPAAPDAPGETGEVIQVNPDGTVTVGTAANPDGVVVPIDQVEPLDDAGAPGQGSGEAPTLDDGWENVMSDYENSLTSSKYKVREKAETGKDFKKPDEKVSEVDSKTQRPKGEVKADEKSKDVGNTKEDLQEPVEAAEDKEEKKSKKEKKSVKESINTSNKGTIMSEDKSIFDKLYESVMGEDDKDFELGIGDDELAPDAGDEFGDEGGEEVTVTLTPDQAAALKAVVDQLPSDDEDLGDIDAEDPLADTDELEDSVQEDTTQTSDGKKPGTDPSDGGGKTTDPAADSLGGKSSGDGAVPVTDKEGTEQTGDGKKPGVAKNSGKPGKQAV